MGRPRKLQISDADYISAAVPLPAWFVDAAMPFLSEAAIKLYVYIIRRTWASGYGSAYFSWKEIMSGRISKDGTRLDWGAQLSSKPARDAMKVLQETKLISVNVVAGNKKVTRMEIRPSWYDDVDWATLMSYRKFKWPGNESNSQTTIPENTSDLSIILPGVLSSNSQDSLSTFAKAASFNPSSVENLSEEGEDIFLSIQAEMRASRGQSPLKMAANSNNVSIRTAVNILNAILEVTGLTKVVEGEGAVSERTHANAVQATIALMGMGVKTPEDVYGIAQSFKASSTYLGRKQKAGVEANKKGVALSNAHLDAITPIYIGDIVATASRLAQNGLLGKRKVEIEIEESDSDVDLISDEELTVRLI